MSKHMKGPWQVIMDRDDIGNTCYLIRQHDKTAIAVAHNGSYWDKDYQPTTDEDGYYQPDNQMDCLPFRVANARLIAAAPDLLKVLETILECGSVNDQHWVDDARAAIAKAEGETE